jgi:hypothetical protein
MTATEFEDGVAASGANAELMPLLPLGQLTAPVDTRISDDGKWLEDRPDAARRSVAVPRDLLLRFTKLADAEPSEILAFAARYGMLRLCASHGLPRLHRHPQLRSFHPVCDGYGTTDDKDRRWFRDSIERWRYFARQALFSLELATAIRSRKPVPRDWRSRLLAGRPFEHFAGKTRARLIEGCEGDTAMQLRLLEDNSPIEGAKLPNATKEREHAWEGVVGIAESWRVWADVELITTVQRPGHARLSIGGIPLFGALAMQLTSALSSVGFALCGACGNSFQPERMPRAGETNYCPACRKKGKPARAAIERHNERLQQARELVAAGVALAEVAKRTGLKPDTVKTHFGQRLNAAKPKTRKTGARRTNGKAR